MKIKSIEKIHLDTPKPFYDVIDAYPYNNFLVKTNTGFVVSHNCLFACLTDEVDFQRVSDVEKQKAKARALISSIDARMKSRFLKGEQLPTLNILASSKRTSQSYLESFIEMKKRNESKTTLVIDEPQWVIRTDKDSPRKFAVAVGNKFLASEVLPLDVSKDEIQAYRDKGYTILMVPFGFYENFIDDLDTALTDIAGISTSSSSKFISGPRWADCRDVTLTNPMTKEVIEVGNSKTDTAQYSDFFDIKKIPDELRYRPLYIHLDMSLSGDKTGIAGVWIKQKAKANTKEAQSKSLFYQLAFSFAVKAPKGFQISFEKTKNFIYWLRDNGFKIGTVTADTFQSASVLQDLSAHGINCHIQSVDRVNNDHFCEPYEYLKSTIYERRISTYKTDLLTEEIINLEKNENGRVDHPMGGTVGSKDIADALCGSVFEASQHAEEFAYDYGEEDIENTVEINADESSDFKKQVTVAFEDELKKMGPQIQPPKDEKKQDESVRLKYMDDNVFIM